MFCRHCVCVGKLYFFPPHSFQLLNSSHLIRDAPSYYRTSYPSSWEAADGQEYYPTSTKGVPLPAPLYPLTHAALELLFQPYPRREHAQHPRP